MSDSPHVAMDMTFPNRNSAGSNVYATELLRELRRREGLVVTEVAGATAGLAGTTGWLLGGARVAVSAADLVHCPAFVAPWRMGKPFVLTVHDTSILDFPEDHPVEWRTYIRTFLARRSRAAARVITGTEHSRREISKDLGVPVERIAVTPYGIAERFLSSPATKGGALGRHQLLFPGAPTRRKNLELLLRAMAESPPESVLRQVRIAISGARGQDFPSHQKRISAMGLGERVAWLGHVPIERMPAVMASSDAVVYPSIQEGFGFPALEAMAVGTPVVASNASCLPEVLGDGAVLVDPADVTGFIAAVEAVLTRRELREDLVAKGRARAALYTWARCADITIAVYRDAVGRGRKPSGGSR